jgi:hypothetical protein
MNGFVEQTSGFLLGIVGVVTFGGEVVLKLGIHSGLFSPLVQQYGPTS